MKNDERIRCGELTQLCEDVRALAACGAYDQCVALIRKYMEEFPHAPQPHNLMGVVLERMGNHTCAMKHFRAAWALDPTYTPASQNLSNYGTFYTNGSVAYDECDCPEFREPVHNSRCLGHFMKG